MLSLTYVLLISIHLLSRRAGEHGASPGTLAGLESLKTGATEADPRLRKRSYGDLLLYELQEASLRQRSETITKIQDNRNGLFYCNNFLLT
jgi:hypothetical protein